MARIPKSSTTSSTSTSTPNEAAPAADQVSAPPVFNSQITPDTANPTTDASDSTPPATPENTAMTITEATAPVETAPESTPPAFDIHTATEEELQNMLSESRTAQTSEANAITELNERLAMHTEMRNSIALRIKELRAELRYREDVADGVIPPRGAAQNGATSAPKAGNATSERKSRGKPPTEAMLFEYLRANPKRTYDMLATHYDISRSSVQNLTKDMRSNGTIIVEYNEGIAYLSTRSTPETTGTVTVN